MIRSLYRSVLLILTLVSLISGTLSAQTVARCGDGWLEFIDDYPVLHLKGTPYEMGYQHGALMKQDVHENLNYLVHEKGNTKLIDFGPIKVTPREIIGTILRIQEPHVPQKFFSELDGLAAGSGLDEHDVRVGNFIPEMFHCSGFALMDSATKDGTLYHGRVLDYAIGWKLQEHAVIIVAEPEGELPFVNVSYAGFIGCVTGMNSNHVSIGEMGGRGLGHWDGIPMAFLVREALQTGHTLEEAIGVFRDNPRTCEYYYVIADAKDNSAVGMEASWDKFQVIRPGERHELLPLPVKDCALLSAGGRYEELVRRVKDKHGAIEAEDALRLMDRGVAMKSNLHNVLFEPKSTRFWVANATPEGEPAADQKYDQFQLSELLKRQPSSDAKVIPLEKPKTVAEK